MKHILAILVVATLSGCASVNHSFVEWFPSPSSPESINFINNLPASAAGGPISESAPTMQVADADPCAGKRMSKIRCKW